MKLTTGKFLANLAAAGFPLAFVAVIVGTAIDYIATALGQPVGGVLHALVDFSRAVFALVGY